MPSSIAASAAEMIRPNSPTRRNADLKIFDRSGRVSRSDAVLGEILEAANQTEAITAIAGDIQPFLQEYGRVAVHLRGLHRKTGLVVMIKVGTSARENFWCNELCRLAPDLVPRVYASGSRLGRIDVHWLASEAIPFGPLGNAWHGREFELLLDAGIRFYQQAEKIRDPTLDETTSMDVSRWLRGSIDRNPPGAVDGLLQKADLHWSFLLEKCGSDICFDDFHLCNGLVRDPPPDGKRVVLIDIHPRRQPWILDPAYLQVLNSSESGRPGHRDLIHGMAARRSEAGLRSLGGPDLVTAGKIALGWMAARQWRSDLAEWQPDYRDAYARFIAEAVEA